MENNIKKAVIYCRVSTKEQVEEGNSLVTQEKNCREYANKHDYEITEVFIEMGESAKTAERTELQKLLKFCADKKNRIQAIIAYKIDRISRNTDDYSQIRIHLKRYGVEIKSTSEHFEDSPAGRFMENIIANVAQFDNDVRTERCIGGMRQAISEGRYVWKAPLGYSNVKVEGKSTISQNGKAAAIKKAFELIANKAMTVEQTRTHIIQYGICQNNGNPIAKSNFYNLLRNKLYIGLICKFGTVCQGTFTPIISEVLFNEVQRVLKTKPSEREYKIENIDFPLRRFVRGPNGKKLTGCWCTGKKNKYPYYRLPGNGKMFPKNYIEKSFADFLNSFSVDTSAIEDLKTKILQKLERASVNKSTLLEGLALRIQQLKQKRNSLIDKNIAGIIPDSVAKEQIENVNTQLWQIENDIEQNRSTTINVQYIFSKLHNLLYKPGDYWMEQPFAIKRRLQVFDFPFGITFDGQNYQTPEICSVFKLGKAIMKNNSLKVNPRVLSNKHPQLAISSPLQDEELMALLQTIQSDLILFDNSIQEQNEESTGLVVPFESRLLKEAG